MKKPFTVADEIGLTQFNPLGGGDPQIRFSPDKKWFAVWSERGRLDLNCVDDSLRFYWAEDVKNYLDHPDASPPPLPAWDVTRSAKEGPIIRAWRWLGDSSGIAFLERIGSGQRLVLADLRTRATEFLTSTAEVVGRFDVRDRQHYVYTIGDPTEREETRLERQSPAIVATGRSIKYLLFLQDPMLSSGRSSLWAVVGDQRFEVKRNNRPINLDGSLTLSPDGQSLVTELVVSDVPSSWETLYLPPAASSVYQIHSGHQDLKSGGYLIHEYVLINLQSASVQTLTDAPISRDVGLWARVEEDTPSWSSDGQEILLPGTFLRSKDRAPSRPCVAVVDLPSNSCTCVETLKGHTETGVEEGYHPIKGAYFSDGSKHRVTVVFYDYQSLSKLTETNEYQQNFDGTWQLVGNIKGDPAVNHDDVEVAVQQGLNTPPRLVAASKQTSRPIWDPNPQLRGIELGQASVYTWKDKEGREWKGGLYKPVGYKLGERYPLVIQTHGFWESEFRPSGIFPTGFAARALAAVGIMVLQVKEVCPLVTPTEGLCAASGYESAANQLVSEGLVDSERVGIIGFSRSCFWVMETLTMASFHFKAALITDGVMEDYFQYLLSAGLGESNPEGDAIIGSKPLGAGLQEWLNRSPGFNLDRVTAPLSVVGEGPLSLLSMWQPYAGLRFLKKPVELIMLNTDEHVLTTPAVRMASQGGSVDWFRFWLKREEDPDPTKRDQYARWRGLRELQEAHGHNSTTAQPPSNSLEFISTFEGGELCEARR